VSAHILLQVAVSNKIMNGDPSGYKRKFITKMKTFRLGCNPFLAVDGSGKSPLYKLGHTVLSCI
jgi:hypothetical protein